MVGLLVDLVIKDNVMERFSINRFGGFSSTVLRLW